VLTASSGECLKYGARNPSGAVFNPPIEAVQEIKVHQNAYSAELGNSSSGVVSVTTRSGTNRYSGLVYEYLRNDAFDATDFLPPESLPFDGMSSAEPLAVR
jgi:hypothetical protein